MQIASSLCWDRVFSDSTQDLKIALLQKPLLGMWQKSGQLFAQGEQNFGKPSAQIGHGSPKSPK
jgi:hypothetical protein